MATQDPDQGTSSDDSSDPAGLRHRADEALSKASEAEARAEAAERRAAFSEAGIPTEGVGALFRKAYDGDVTDEAIKASASEYGIFDQAKGTAPPTDAETQVMGTVASGLVSSDAPQPVSGEQAINLEIVKLAQAGDEDALLGYLEAQGLLMDPDAEVEMHSLLNKIPSVSGVTGVNPV